MTKDSVEARGAYESEDMADLHDRLIDAAAQLLLLARNGAPPDKQAMARLTAKREGVLLALDYMRAYQRPLPSAPERSS